MNSENNSKWKPTTLVRRLPIPEDRRPVVLGVAVSDKRETNCELTRLDVLRFAKGPTIFHSVDCYLTAADNEKGYMPLLHYYVSVNDTSVVYPAKANIFQVDGHTPQWKKFTEWLPQLITELEAKTNTLS